MGEIEPCEMDRQVADFEDGDDFVAYEGSPSSTEAAAGTAVDDMVSDSREASGRVFGRVSSVLSNGAAFVENKLNALGDAWDSVDHAGEKYAQRFEGLVKPSG